MISEHTIYGVFLKRNLIYVGCTKHFPNRLTGLCQTHPVLSKLKTRLSIRRLAVAKNKRAGHRTETRLIERHISCGKFLLNECPSATIFGISAKRKLAWKKHWSRIGSRRASDLELGRRNWTAETFNKAKEILNGVAKIKDIPL